MSDDRPTPTGLAGGSNLDQLMPVVLFFVLFNTVGIIWAVLAALIDQAVAASNYNLVSYHQRQTCIEKFYLVVQ